MKILTRAEAQELTINASATDVLEEQKKVLLYVVNNAITNSARQGQISYRYHYIHSATPVVALVAQDLEAAGFDVVLDTYSDELTVSWHENEGA